MTPLDFRQLFYALPDKYLLLDASGTVPDLDASHAASSLGGRSWAEVVGQHFLAVWPPNPGRLVFAYAVPQLVQARKALAASPGAAIVA